MKLKVIRHEAAQRDMAGHVKHIARDSPQSARRFLEALEQTFDRLAGMPGIGTQCEFRNPAAAGLRYWRIQGFRNHFIIYRPTETGIEVIRVLHAAQNWEAIFEPESSN